jgi:hypothetical protein
MESEYQPLTLGEPRTHATKPRDRSNNNISGSPRHETWREGLSGPKPNYEPHPEAQVLDRLRQAAPHHHPKLWMVLGEPGAGKSRLLEEWFRRWASNPGEPRLGLCVPVLVRLRSLRAEDIRIDAKELADRLWVQGVEEWSRLGQSAIAIYQAEAGRLYRPVWLLDGLDEVPPAVLGPDLPRKLAALPGVKVMTCRTAVFQTLREHAAAYQETEHAILDLRPDQQQALLGKFLGNVEQAAELSKQIRANVQLAGLAGNPLMLSLIAEVWDERSLPTSRAEFYQKGAAELWHRRLTGQVALQELRSQRDPVLIALASGLGLEVIEASLDLLDEAIRMAGVDHILGEALQQSGLIAINKKRETVAFIHLTFQEFYLACSLKPARLRPVLERYWDNVRYEETLGLLISLLATEHRYSEIADSLDWLVDWGRQRHHANPKRLWQPGRSPLRVVLHLVRRAGIRLEALGLMSSRMTKEATRSKLVKIAVASDTNMPAEMMAMLAHDGNKWVRRAVAINPATPAEVLAALANDENKGVRRAVAINPATPAEVLAALANDPDRSVRRMIPLWNPATPAEVLATLANDPDRNVRVAVAQNSATPPEVLVALASDSEKLNWMDTMMVRQAVGENPATPAEVLAALAADLDEGVLCWAVAQNPATPTEVLAMLADNPDRIVRVAVAQNPATPAEVLAVLADNPDRIVRAVVARNPATPAEVLAVLARDGNKKVRAAVTHALDRIVRAAMARNRATPAEMLAVLANDPDEEVREEVAENPVAPTEVLAALARDGDKKVRRAVARNPATPAKVLAALARDENKGVRRAVASNASTVLEDLTTGIAASPGG